MGTFLWMNIYFVLISNFSRSKKTFELEFKICTLGCRVKSVWVAFGGVNTLELE